MSSIRHAILALIVLVATLVANGPTMAAPTPVPGGANQTGGVSGKLGGVLFNGTYRLRKMSLAPQTPADHAGKLETVVFHAIISNGTTRSMHGFFNAAMADADGVTVEGRPLDDGWDLQPGAAARTAYGFALPAGFVPVRLVLIEAAREHPKAFRIAIAGSDLPAAPTPAST